MQSKHATWQAFCASGRQVEYKIWYVFLLGKEIFLGSLGNPRNKPKVLPWIAWCFNMAHRSMIWWFIFSPVGHPRLIKQPPEGPSLIRHQKFTNRDFYIQSLIKKKYLMKILIRDPCRFVLLGKEIFLGSTGNPRNKPKVLPWIAWCFNMAHRSMIWWFIFSPVGHPRLIKQPPEGPSLIRHQKFTNRDFYIQSLIKKKYLMKILIRDPCRFVLLGKEIFLGSTGNPRNKPKVLPWIAWCFNMAHRSMIWWFIFSPVGHPRLIKQPPEGPSLIRHQKFTNRDFYIQSLIKKKYLMKILIRDPCRFVLLGKEIFLGSTGNPRNKPKVLPWIAWCFNMAHRSMIWWFIFSPVGHPRLIKQPPEGPSLIRHQKFTNRDFYIQSLIKKKYLMKILIRDPCRFVLLGKEIFLGSTGNPRNKPKVLPWIAWCFNMAHRSMIWWFIFSPVGHPRLIKTTTKGSKPDSARKLHKSSILCKEFNKEKISYENIDLGSMPLCFFGKRNLPGKYGEPQKQTKGFTMDSLMF